MTTNYVRGSYQEIIDLHTESDTVTAIGIHTPTGNAPRRMFQPFFDAYRQYHYDGCSLALVPAATLPADIAQVSYEAGEPPIDARDILNPILWHGCHGEDMGVILDTLLNGASHSNDSAMVRDISTPTMDMTHCKNANGNPLGQILETIYYKGLTDKTWAKAHPQRGFRKGGLHPLVYDLATNVSQPTGTTIPANTGGTSNLAPTGIVTGRAVDTGETYIGGGASLGPNGTGQMASRWPVGEITDTFNASNLQMTVTANPSREGLAFFTPRMRGLGWLETRVRYMTSVPSVSGTVTSASDAADLYKHMADRMSIYQSYNPLPFLYMGLILLPPAYKAEQHFRLIINHRFSWRGFRGISMDSTWEKDSLNYYYLDPMASKSEDKSDDEKVVPDDMR